MKEDMIIKKLVVGQMQANCYIFGDPKTKEVFIIDPGGGHDRIKAVLEKNAYKVKGIINTHGHADHIGANGYFNLPISIHKEDAPFLRDSKKNLSSLLGFSLQSPAAEKLLVEGDVLEAGGLALEVIHTPGHTPGSICLKGDGILFTGDTLFCGGIGRSDFPYGSQELLYSCLKNKILTCDEDTIVYPGHGPATTIGSEKKNNPFL